MRRHVCVCGARFDSRPRLLMHISVLTGLLPGRFTDEHRPDGDEIEVRDERDDDRARTASAD